MIKAGRKKLTDLEKAMSKASRAHKKFMETLTPEFKKNLELKEVQFAESDNKMGRPLLKLYKIQERAVTEWTKALEEYREYEKENGVKAVSEEKIIEYKQNEKAGRNVKDDVLYLMKYIRQTEELITKTKESPEAFSILNKTIKGRPAMSKAEKIVFYSDRLSRAQKELKDKLSNKERHEVLYYELFDLKNKRRTIKMDIKSKEQEIRQESGQDEIAINAQLTALNEDLFLVEAAISFTEIEHKTEKNRGANSAKQSMFSDPKFLEIKKKAFDIKRAQMQEQDRKYREKVRANEEEENRPVLKTANS